MKGTPIDEAHAAAAAEPGDEALALRFHERVLDAELLLVLSGEGEAELRPLVLELEEGRLVLGFDRDDRLADFLGEPAPFVALSGREAVRLLAGQGLGLALNPGAGSATVLDAAAVGWLAGMAAEAPDEAAALARRFVRPDPPQALLAALGPKLASMAGRIASAHLVEAHYADASAHPLLVLAGVPEGARAGVAAAVAEAVRFSGPEGVALDVAFLEPGTPGHAAAARVGLRLDLPPREAPERRGPGMDPGRPPRLGTGRAG